MMKKMRRALAIMLALFLAGNAFADHYVSARADYFTESLTANEAGGEIGGQNGFHVSAFEVLVDGQRLEECESVYAGAEVKVHFQWSLDNNVTAPSPFSPQTYTINTGSDEFKNSGIDFSQMTAGTAEHPSPLDQNGKVVGSYYIQDGIIYITISDENIYLNEANRNGGVFFYGKIAKDGDKTHDGTQKDIEFGTVSSNVIYYDSPDPSSASVWKNPGGRIFYENGKYYQTFQAGVRASNGKVTDVKLEDIVSHGDKLTYAALKRCKITDSSVDGLVKDSTFDSLEELFAAIKGATFYNNESVTFEYTMEVASDIFDPDQDSYSNTIDGEYKSNRKETETINPATATVQVTKPSISKTASDYIDGKVSWTITVNVGDLYEEGKNKLSDYFESVEDIPGQGLKNQGRVSLTLDDFKPNENNPREFTYTYETEVLEKVKDSIVDQTIKNSAEMTRGDKTYPSNEAQYVIKNNGVKLEKSFYQISEQDGVITWEIKITGLTNGVGTLYLEDYLEWKYAAHDILDWLEVDGTVVRENGSYLNNSNPTVIDVNHTNFDNLKNYAGNVHLTLTDEYVQQSIKNHNGEIRLKVKSQIKPYQGNDGEGKLHEYINNVKGSYKSADSTQELPPVKASYTDASDILSKTGTKSGLEVEYEIRVPMQYLDIQAGGEGFVISDELDPRMQYVKDSVSVTLGNEFFTKRVILEPSEYECSLPTTDNKISFRIPVSTKIINELQDNNILAIHYKAEYKDLAALVTDPEAGKNIINHAEGTYNGKGIGDSTTSNNIDAPRSIISKTADYDKETAPYVQYTVDINPDALTLLGNGAKLKAEDTLAGDVLIFVNVDSSRFAALDSSNKERYRVKVYEWATVSNDNNEWQEWVELKAPLDYTYAFKNERQLTFELPDSKHLRIEYYGYTVAAPGTPMTSSNSTNTFKLSSFTTEATQGEHYFENREVENYGYVNSDTGSITLFKYWTDGDEQLALAGSVFKIVSVQYDAATQKWVEGDVLKDNICIPENERENSDGKIQINGLPLKKWMALYEIDADTGYAINKKPHYFYIQGIDDTATPSAHPGEPYDVFKVDEVNPLDYPNKKAASLQLEKTIIGNVTQEEAEGALRFKVTDPDGISTVYRLSEFDYDASSGKWTKSLERLMPGKYTVEETVYDIDGHKVTSVKYSIDNSGKWLDGKDAKVPVELKEGENTTVTYQNTYPGTYPVVISKKAVGGDEELEGAILEITGIKANGKSITPIRWKTEKDATTNTVKPFEVALEPGEYTLTEISAPKGYQIAEKITFTVGATGNIKIVSTSGELDGTTIVMRDAPIDISLHKVEDYQGNPVAGAEISVFRAEDMNGNKPKADADPVYVGMTPENGILSFGIALTANADGTPREYVIVETKTPDTHKTATPIHIWVQADGTVVNKADAPISSVRMIDVPIGAEVGTLVITKTISGDLAFKDIKDDLVFHVKGIDGKAAQYDETFSIKEFDEDGDNTYRLELYPLELGTYQVTESDKSSTDVRCSTTYKVVNGSGEPNNNGVVVSLPEKDDEVSVEVANNYQYIKGSILLRKSFASSADTLKWDDIKKKLSFLVYEGDVIEGKEPVTKVRGDAAEWTKVAGEENQWEYELELKIGTYTVIEECDPIDDYVSMTTYTMDKKSGTGAKVENVTVTENTVKTVTYSNTYVSPVYISKKAITGTKEIDRSATLTVSGKANDGTQFSDEWTTGKEPHMLQLKPGKYTLTEKTAPKGYAKAKDIEFTINDKGDIIITSNQANSLNGRTVTMWDAPLSLKMNKMALATNESGAVLSGENKVGVPLKGAEIEIYEVKADKSRVLMTSWRSAGTNTPHDFGPDLYAGRSYVLVEKRAPQDYLIAKEIAFTIADDGTVKVASVQDNNYYRGSDGVIYMLDKKSDQPLASLLLTKSIKGMDYADANGLLSFKVECVSGEGVGYEETFTIGGQGSNGFTWDGEKYTCLVPNLTPGSYKVTESWTDSDSIVCQERSYTIKIIRDGEEYGTSTPVKDSSNTIGRFSTLEFSLAGGNTAEVNFENTYVTKGTLIITKTIAGDATKKEVEGVVTFTVTENSTGKKYAYTLKNDFKYNTKTKQWTKELVLTAGGYTIEESGNTLDGKKCVTTYTVNGGTSRDGTLVQNVVVEQGGKTTVAYTNTYSASIYSDDDGDSSVLIKKDPNLVTDLTKTGDGATIGAWLLLLLFGVAEAIDAGYALSRRKKKDGTSSLE